MVRWQNLMGSLNSCEGKLCIYMYIYITFCFCPNLFSHFVCINYYVWWLNENITTAAARLWQICWVLVFNMFTLSLWWIILSNDDSLYQSRSRLASVSFSIPFSHFLKLYVSLRHTDILYVSSSMWHLRLCHPIFNPSLRKKNWSNHLLW